MKAEKWIWLELSAFDPEKAGLGVEYYIEKAGFTPDGISLMLNAIDFVLLYDGMSNEYPLFDEVNGRGSGHPHWTNHQLRQLVHELKGHGIKVFFSVFTFYWMSQTRKEFIARYPKCAVVHCEQGKTRAVDVLARLDDGSYLEDIFAKNLHCIMHDYQFSGWHGPDWFGPGGSLKSSCSDNLIGQFIEYLGEKVPGELERIASDQPEKLKQRVEFITATLNLEWLDFLSWRWEGFWRKMNTAVKSAGGECMINSPHTRSSWEASVSTGIDYRRIAALGVEYLVVETVAANFDLCNGNDKVKDRISVYNAVFQELKMSVPKMKLLFLHCIKDPGESYDVLRHTPAKLEHEFFRLTNLFFQDTGKDLQRCADGFLVCLGNSIEAHEWNILRNFWKQAWNFSPVEAGDFVWLFEPNALDEWRLEYLRYGTPSPSAQAAYLTTMYDLHSPVIWPMGALGELNSPAAVFNFACCDKRQIEGLLNFKNAPLLLLGNIAGLPLPENATVIATVTIDKNYQFGGVILNSGGPAIYESVEESIKTWHYSYASIFELFPAMALPESFWHTIAMAWRKTVDHWYGNSRIRPPYSENLRTFSMWDAAGNELLALCSYAPRYIAPELYFNSDAVDIEKVSSFPEAALRNKNGKLWTEIAYAPPNIPPMGILILQVKKQV